MKRGEDGSDGVKILCLSLEQRRHRCQRTKIPQRGGQQSVHFSALLCETQFVRARVSNWLHVLTSLHTLPASPDICCENYDRRSADGMRFKDGHAFIFSVCFLLNFLFWVSHGKIFQHVYFGIISVSNHVVCQIDDIWKAYCITFIYKWMLLLLKSQWKYHREVNLRMLLSCIWHSKIK